MTEIRHVIMTMDILKILTCIYNGCLLILFLVIHCKKQKVSYLYHMVFYLSILILTYLELEFMQNIIWLGFLITTLVFLLSVMNFSYIRKSYEDRVNEYQYKVIGQQVNEVQNIYQTMRGWRHDYHNHMQTLKAHLAMNNYDLAGEYLNELENDLDSIDLLIKTGNMNLDAILNSKISLAKTKEIKIHCKANVPGALIISDIDLCVLIGNLLDNAVEACEEIKEGEDKFMRIYIGLFKQQFYISVTNSTNEIIRKIDADYITKKRGNHGHGLKRIDIIVNKYHGFINRKNEPGVFVTEIMLPL
jgi:two-component system, LytTR family, sensor histidine kinase AgrC